MYKVLITGSTGFIGSKLVCQLKALGYDVLEFPRVSGDIVDTVVWDSLPKVDIVFHLAAISFVPDSWLKPDEFIRVNFLGTIRALEYCKKFSTKLVFFSTYLYGNQGTLPINENADIFAMNPYAFSKRLAEEACEFYVNCFNISVVVLRVFNVYGPGQREPFLIPTIVRQVLSASSSVYVKNLYTKRDYIYVDDLISLALKVFQLDGFHVFNAGSGLSYSVLDLIQQIERILCRRIEITSSEEYRINEIVETKADISKAFGKVGWKPYWNIGDGLTKVIQSAKLNNLN